MYHIFGYLGKCHNAELVFDPSFPGINMDDFERRCLTNSEFGHLLEEYLKPERPSNMPVPRGVGFTLRGKVDSYHAADTVTRRSRTISIMCLNSSPTCWFFKNQISVESDSFGSEFTAMKQTCEHL